MIREWLGGDPGPLRLERRTATASARRPGTRSSAQLAARPPEHRLVKLQVTGPVTLAIALERGAGRIGAGAAVGLARARGRRVARGQRRRAGRAAWRDLGLDVLLVVDEPGLAHAGADRRRRRSLGSAARCRRAAWGMHVCGPVPWELIDAPELDVLSFDVAALRPAAAGAPRAAPAALRRGGRVAWGVLDPVAPATGRRGDGRGAARLSALGQRPAARPDRAAEPAHALLRHRPALS